MKIVIVLLLIIVLLAAIVIAKAMLLRWSIVIMHRVPWYRFSYMVLWVIIN